jgi:hypothetical protein
VQISTLDIWHGPQHLSVVSVMGLLPRNCLFNNPYAGSRKICGDLRSNT